ncbi:MAG: hypothetical protein U0800_16685 [Isosphaeraceae bacterium]
MIRRFARTGAAALILSLLPAIARAQEAGGGGSPDSGDATYSYIGWGLLSAGIMFLLCKSARRSA